MRAGRWLDALIFVSLLAALWALGRNAGGRELTDVTLVQTLGVDGAGPVTLTATGEAEAGPICRTARGPDIVHARSAMALADPTRLELTHIAQLVLGPETPVEETLWQALLNRKSGCNATIWLSRGPAEALVAGAEQPFRRLRTLEESGPVTAPTLLEAAWALAEEGRVDLPVLALEDGVLQVVDVATVEGG